MRKTEKERKWKDKINLKRAEIMKIFRNGLK